VIETHARVLCIPRFLDKLTELNPNEVVVRLNAGEAAVHDTMARVPGAFEQTLRGLDLLKEHAIPFSVRLRRHPDNESSVEMARKLAGKSGAAHFEIVDI
jgi:MoaA/NifB/PqqE/SkfB family radical SAM enzyme